MKKFLRPLLLGLILSVGVSLLTGCGKKADYAIRVGDLKISENDYYRNVLALRSNYLASLNEEDSVALWTEPMDDGATMSDVFVDYINNHLIEQKLYAQQFERLGLSFAENEEQAIHSALSEAVENAGGMSTFTAALAQENYTYDEYLEEIYDSAKKSKVLAYYYGEGGVAPVSTQDIKDYYNVHNARVKVVFILKVDASTGEALGEEALAEARRKAEDVYNLACKESETDQFDEIISLYSDDTSSKGSGIVVSENGGYNEEMTSAALAMEVGEVTRLELENGFMILKRYDGTADDVFTSTMRQATLETLRADDISAMLEDWKKDSDIQINTKITKKYLPEKLVEES
ncbi:MAG: hypothetical protein DBX52_04050 [Clostridiales bacterium]|nr:MAG: hypothetical protein DBX52_04050 [Clostridiales bacterium]